MSGRDPTPGADLEHLSALSARPRVDDACLSDLELDEVVATRAPSVRQTAHFKACDRCRGRLAIFQAGAAQSGLLVGRLLAAAEAEVGAVSRPARRRAPWLSPSSWQIPGWAAPAFAAAALLVSVGVGTATYLEGEGPTPSSSVGTRTKGGTVRVFVKRGEEVRRAHSGDLFLAGDAVRFVVTAPEGLGEETWFLMIGIEASGDVMTYYPFGGERSMRLPSGSEVPLPDSLVLDRSPDTEFLLSLFSGAPVDAAEVTAALHELGTPVSLDRLVGLELPGAAQWTVLRKGDVDDGAAVGPSGEAP